MEFYRISIGQNLTSYRFYHELLPQLRTYAQNKESVPIRFDFTDTVSVSPLVIPNLLCLGHIIRSNYDHTPIINVPDKSSSDNLRAYLHDIDFVDLARYFGLFQFTDSIDYGPKKKMTDRLSATHQFNPELDGRTDESAVRSLVQQYYGKFFKKYLSDFKYSPKNVQPWDQGESNYCNLVEELCTEMIHNSLERGLSFAFMTAQINFSRQKIYLSIADCGVGLKAGVNHKIEANEDPFDGRDRLMESELEAIANAIFARANEMYGIYEPIKRTLNLGGIVRIHSVNTRLILTENLSIKLEVASHDRSDIAKMRNSFLGFLRDSNGEYTRNVETGIKCGGTHIEVEIPLNRGVG